MQISEEAIKEKHLKKVSFFKWFVSPEEDIFSKFKDAIGNFMKERVLDLKQ